jgi:hypothetical protein
MDDQPEITKEQPYRAAVGEPKDDFYTPRFLAFEESESSRRIDVRHIGSLRITKLRASQFHNAISKLEWKR